MTDSPVGDGPPNLRGLLPRAHAAFFGRFAGPTPIQALAIPVILEGGDVLVCASTGTGKTEAYTAPVVERLLAEPRAPLRFLIVSPTRALANDLFRRLEPVFASLALPFGRLTGEHKERVDGRSPDVAVTTPEALDSMLARRPESLGSLSTIALDEIHVLDGTPRGDQLRLLLHRLDGVARRPPQRVAASATVPRPESLAARYLRDARVVASAAARAIQARSFCGREAPDMARHVDAIAEAGHRKILVFCNSRAAVEDLALGLRGATRFGSAVFPHHGSLSRGERERTERRFLEAPAAVAVATMTLELGIDIGSVDYVLLDGPPPSVSSLLQRIGRGGRRADGAGLDGGPRPARVAYAFAGEAQRELMKTLLRRAAKGDLCADETWFRPSVLVQQALVLAGGSGSVTAEALSLSLPEDLRATFGSGAVEAILAEMLEHELLEAPLRGRHVLAERTERAFARGTLHGNIDPEGGLDVVDRLSGEVLGRVPSPADVGGQAVQLGGRSYVAVREVEGILLTDAAREPAAARFAPRGAPSLSFALGRAFASDLGAAADEILQGRHGTSTLLIHGLGTIGGRFLAELVTRKEGRGAVLDTSPMKLRLARPLVDLPRPVAEELARHARAHERWLARRLGMGPYHAKLPADLRADAVRRASPLDAVAAFLGRARLQQRPATDELPAFWGDL